MLYLARSQSTLTSWSNELEYLGVYPRIGGSQDAETDLHGP